MVGVFLVGTLQGFPAQRAVYLGKHVRAMETMARKLSGETFSLMQRFFLRNDTLGEISKL